ncbi:hypothetical protein Bca4012_065173 [Brassica carinata]
MFLLKKQVFGLPIIHTKKTFCRFLFPAPGALLFGYEIGATFCAIISIKITVSPFPKTVLRLFTRVSAVALCALYLI